MRTIIFVLILMIATGFCANAQVLGISAVDTVHRTKNVAVKEPKSELGNIGYNPDNGASKNPSDKKADPQPELAPNGKPKLED